MAQEIGLALRAGLPKDNGLAPRAPDLADDVQRRLVIAAIVRVEDIVTHVTADTQTVVTRFDEIEAMDDDLAEEVQKLLRRQMERRTGRVQLPGFDGDPADVAEQHGPGGSTGDKAEERRQASAVKIGPGDLDPAGGEQGQQDEPVDADGFPLPDPPQTSEPEVAAPDPGQPADSEPAKPAVVPDPGFTEPTPLAGRKSRAGGKGPGPRKRA